MFDEPLMILECLVNDVPVLKREFIIPIQIQHIITPKEPDFAYAQALTTYAQILKDSPSISFSSGGLPIFKGNIIRAYIETWVFEYIKEGNKPAYRIELLDDDKNVKAVYEETRVKNRPFISDGEGAYVLDLRHHAREVLAEQVSKV